MKRLKEKKRKKRKKRSSIPEDRIYLVLLAVFGCIFLAGYAGQRVYARFVRGEEVSDVGTQVSSKRQGEAAAEETAGRTSDGKTDGEADVESDGESTASPVYWTVEDDYFEDAVFIGDSRTVGLYEYGGLQETSTFYASTGLSVHKLFSAKIVEVPGEKEKQTVEEALSQRQFAKIYLMIGINDMGTGTAESFLRKYAECVEHLRELQPDAIIYLQSIMQVTAERSEQGDYVTGEGIDERNEGIAALADNETIFYLDVNQVVCDETGYMIADYTHDGVHLKAQYVSLWKDFLKCHAIAVE